LTRIKICGITSIKTALGAAAAGVDAVGIVFASSRRQVSVEIARGICRSLPPFVSKVGVFVNAKEQSVKDIAQFCGLDALQFHGQETAEYCSRFTQKVIKGLRIRDEESLKLLAEYQEFPVLLDSYCAGQMGGSGYVFPWDLAVQSGLGPKMILAGGLCVDNVLKAIETVKPFAVDVSSGVETNGSKDMAKIREFILTIRRRDYYGC